MELRYHGSAMPYRSCYLYIGQQLNGRLKVKFDNPYLFVAAVLVVYESSLLIGPVGLNHNSYKDVLQLTVGSTSALYAVCFISKKLEKWRIGKVLEVCGRESFYIMGLHIVRFKLCTMSLMALGIIEGGLENLMTPHLCIPADCLYVVRFVLSCRFYVCIKKIEIISVAKYALC